MNGEAAARAGSCAYLFGSDGARYPFRSFGVRPAGYPSAWDYWPAVDCADSAVCH